MKEKMAGKGKSRKGAAASGAMVVDDVSASSSSSALAAEEKEDTGDVEDEKKKNRVMVCVACGLPGHLRSLSFKCPKNPLFAPVDADQDERFKRKRKKRRECCPVCGLEDHFSGSSARCPANERLYEKNLQKYSRGAKCSTCGLAHHRYSTAAKCPKHPDFGKARNKEAIDANNDEGAPSSGNGMGNNEEELRSAQLSEIEISSEVLSAAVGKASAFSESFVRDFLGCPFLITRKEQKLLLHVKSKSEARHLIKRLYQKQKGTSMMRRAEIARRLTVGACSEKIWHVAQEAGATLWAVGLQKRQEYEWFEEGALKECALLQILWTLRHTIPPVVRETFPGSLSRKFGKVFACAEALLQKFGEMFDLKIYRKKLVTVRRQYMRRIVKLELIAMCTSAKSEISSPEELLNYMHKMITSEAVEVSDSILPAWMHMMYTACAYWLYTPFGREVAEKYVDRGGPGRQGRFRQIHESISRRVALARCVDSVKPSLRETPSRERLEVAKIKFQTVELYARKALNLCLSVSESHSHAAESIASVALGYLSTMALEMIRIRVLIRHSGKVDNFLQIHPELNSDASVSFSSDAAAALSDSDVGRSGAIGNVSFGSAIVVHRNLSTSIDKVAKAFPQSATTHYLRMHLAKHHPNFTVAAKTCCSVANMFAYYTQLIEYVTILREALRFFHAHGCAEVCPVNAAGTFLQSTQNEFFEICSYLLFPEFLLRESVDSDYDHRSLAQIPREYFPSDIAKGITIAVNGYFGLIIQAVSQFMAPHHNTIGGLEVLEDNEICSIWKGLSAGVIAAQKMRVVVLLDEDVKSWLRDYTFRMVEILNASVQSDAWTQDDSYNANGLARLYTLHVQLFVITSLNCGFSTLGFKDAVTHVQRSWEDAMHGVHLSKRQRTVKLPNQTRISIEQCVRKSTSLAAVCARNEFVGSMNPSGAIDDDYDDIPDIKGADSSFFDLNSKSGLLNSGVRLYHEFFEGAFMYAIDAL